VGKKLAGSPDLKSGDQYLNIQLADCNK